MTISFEQQVGALLEGWPAAHVSCFVLDLASGDSFVWGNPRYPYRYASVSKLASAIAVMSAISEGVFALDDVTSTGLVVCDLLAHSSGLATDLARHVPVREQLPLTLPRTRRIYSNAGFEVLATLLEDRSAMTFGEYVEEVLFRPLGMSGASISPSNWDSAGSTGAAAGIVGTLDDLLALALALVDGTAFVDRALLQGAKVPHLPELPGVLPGFGEMQRNLWGLGMEIRGDKTPHWTGSLNSPETYGHFGAAGTFLWIDPTHRLACGTLTDRNFGPWAQSCWPQLSTLIVSNLR